MENVNINIQENQKELNQALDNIVDYFAQLPFINHFERMLCVQTQVIGLMELAKSQVISDRMSEGELETDEIRLFFSMAKHYLDLLKPFAELSGHMAE